jgi:hypothetical protein
MEPEKHICGKCGKEFATEEEYLGHVCEVTGFTPRDMEHQGEDFKAISDAAIARGEARKENE